MEVEKKIKSSTDDIEDQDANKERDWMKIKLSEPLEYQGQKVTSLDISGLEKMTLDDMNGLYDTYALIGGAGMVMQETTMRFAQLAAASATGYPIEMIGKLKAKDALKLKNRVYRFFYR